ncbi:hypothetical protein, partial [Micromonospora qiuiae]|uniref:hypothetical protein n=1 Tax=Micromonospora qiuiae TaxID=502268 RepID=UPI00194F3D23
MINQQIPHPADIDTGRRRVVKSTVTTSKTTRQRHHRTIHTQHRVGELEQRIRTRRQAAIERTTEPDKLIPTRRTTLLAPSHRLRHTNSHGHRFHLLQVLWKEPEEDHAVAAPRHANTPSATDTHRRDRRPHQYRPIRAAGNRRGGLVMLS